MTLDPLLDASLAVQLHVLAVIPAMILAPWLLLMRKGTPRHRLLGRVWLVAMAVTAISALFIHEIRLIGIWSPIHLLSFLTLASCLAILRSARAGRVREHRLAVLGLFWMALVGAGLFTLLPGRIMHEVMLTPSPWPGGLILAGLAAGLVGLALHPVSTPLARR